MAKPKLVAIGPNEVASEREPQTMLEAVESSRREFLARARRLIATEIDNGVPTYQLGRLVAEMAKIDAEIRMLDGAAFVADEPALVEDEVWSPDMI